MTVVIEEQIKTIADEINDQFGDGLGYFASDIDIEDVVRSVISQYDISNIAKLESGDEQK